MASSSSSSLLAMFVMLVSYFTSLALCFEVVHVQFSTISAAPALLPAAPLPSLSPSLPPDIEPLFPTPKGMTPSPSESSLPTIPASPSPPNPDFFSSPGPEPDVSLPPSGFLPAASSTSSASLTSPLPLSLVVLLGLLLFCLMQLSAM